MRGETLFATVWFDWQRGQQLPLLDEPLQAEGWHLPDAAVAAGLAEVSWPARLEVVARRPLIVLDCAHNVASAVFMMMPHTTACIALPAPRLT